MPVGAKTVEWTVDVNTGLKAMAEATLTESFDSKLTFDSVKVYKVAVNIYGEVISSIEPVLVPESEYKINEDGTVLELGAINEAYRVVYTTTVNNPGTLAGTVDFDNNITLNDGVTTHPASADASTTYKELLNKTASYDASKQEINWTVDYNFNQAEISKENAKLTDAITSGEKWLLLEK